MPKPRLAWPERIPVRSRIAATCAGLTFLILLCFAGVLGSLVSDRMRNDFNDEVRDGASSLAAELGFNTTLGATAENRRLNDSAMAGDGVIRIVDRLGNPISPDATTSPFAELGAPARDVVHTGRYSVASSPIQGTAAFVQYAKPYADVEATIDRLWLFLGAGVLGGTVLALLAGLAVANRALKPIAGLTSQAREIQETRDPSLHMPIPAADDEIGELAKTMDEMLAALDEARGERERSFDRQREFVADASHELRTPLTSVQANLELLQASLERRSDGDPDDLHAIDSALGSTRRMSRLVSDLLLLARADAGRRSARTETDLSAVSKAVVRELEPIVEGTSIQPALEDELMVRGNPDELHRLVLNLVENAVRHTPEGSNVHVSARADADDALLEVADDGPGIPADIRDQVFDRFVRGQGPADTAAKGGSGLGLAIVRAVAESHGGSVRAGDSPHGGALFTVRIPLAQVDGPPVGSTADEAKPPASGRATRPAGAK